MAEFYLDISAVGNEYQAYADTPATWGIPQDGNGKAGPGHSAAVAIATLDCTSAVGDGAQTLSILGVTVSDASAGSGATLAASLVTSINGTATATTATYCQALLPLNKLIFARQNPGNTAQVQVMLRIAGTDWNGIAPTHAGFTTGPTITAFTGGADGPYGYLCAVTNVFGKTAPTWGCMSSLKVGAVTEPGSADVINVRTRRGGDNLTLSYSTSSSISWSLVPSGGSRNFLFDDGTVWSGDAGQLTIQLHSTNSGTGGVSLATNGRVALASKDNYKRLKWLCSGSTFQPGISTSVGFATLMADNILFEVNTTSGTGHGWEVSFISNAGHFVYFNRCKFRNKGAGRVWALSANGSQKCTYNACEFEYYSLTANVSGLITGTPGTNCGVEFVGCKFYDINGVYAVSNPINITSNNSAIRIVFDGCEGVSDVAMNSSADTQSERILTWDNPGPYRDFRTETAMFLSEWRYGTNQPTLDAMLPNGTLWSIKCLLRAAGQWQQTHRVARLFPTYRQGTASREVKVEILAQRAIKNSELGLLVVYADENDVVRAESSFSDNIVTALMDGGTTLPTSAAAWAMNGQTGFTAYKLTLTTAYQVKTMTDVNVYVIWRGPQPSDQTVYINPKVDFT